MDNPLEGDDKYLGHLEPLDRFKEEIKRLFKRAEETAGKIRRVNDLDIADKSKHLWKSISRADLEVEGISVAADFTMRELPAPTAEILPPTPSIMIDGKPVTMISLETGRNEQRQHSQDKYNIDISCYGEDQTYEAYSYTFIITKDGKIEKELYTDRGSTEEEEDEVESKEIIGSDSKDIEVVGLALNIMNTRLDFAIKSVENSDSAESL